MRGISLFFVGFAVGLALTVSCGKNVGDTGGALVLADGTTIPVDEIMSRISSLEAQAVAQQSDAKLVGGCEIRNTGYTACYHNWGSAKCITNYVQSGVNTCSCDSGTKVRLSGDPTVSGNGIGSYGCRMP